MKEALIALAAILGSIAGIGVGQYLTQSASLMVASYSAPPQSLSNNTTMRAVIIRIDPQSKTAIIQIASPYPGENRIEYKTGLDAGSYASDGVRSWGLLGTAPTDISNKTMAVIIEQQKDGVLYLRNARPALAY